MIDLKANDKSIRNIAILAHVDAGKTTLTEHMLYKSGAIRQLGEVDKGTTQSDTIDVEKKRGISVRLSQVSFAWLATCINLIDTPGHVDFSAEVEYSLRAIDGAVLMVSAVEGVQSHTSSIMRALHNLSIPFVVFINKIDRAGADVEAVVDELKQEIDISFMLLDVVEGEGSQDVVVRNIKDVETRNGYSQNWDRCQELIAETSEDLLDEYLTNGYLCWKSFYGGLKESALKTEVVPVMCGSAKNDMGVEGVMNGIIEFLPGPNGSNDKPLSGVVYKVDEDKVMGKVANVRVFQGVLKNRMPIWNATKKCEEKCTRISRVEQQQKIVRDTLEAGDVGQVAGLSQVQAGDILGIELGPGLASQLNTPLLTVKITPLEDKDYMSLVDAIKVLSAENPLLNMKWLKTEKELHIDVMGDIQIEILDSVLKSRFGVNAAFSNPVVIYKETPLIAGQGYERYTMPKPCWAVVRFAIEPGAIGSGVVFDSKVSVNDVARKYQHEVERTIPKALEQGIKGWEVTDIKITFIEGEDHVMHSRPGDFCVATPMGIMNGLVNVGTKLLEPILDFKITAPESQLGTIASDLTRMRATFANPEFRNHNFILTGQVPLSTSHDYHIKLNSRTSGKGKMITSFLGYLDCPEGQGVEREYKSVSPLDRSKYILKARKALQE